MRCPPTSAAASHPPPPTGAGLPLPPEQVCKQVTPATHYPSPPHGAPRTGAGHTAVHTATPCPSPARPPTQGGGGRAVVGHHERGRARRHAGPARAQGKVLQAGGASRGVRGCAWGPLRPRRAPRAGWAAEQTAAARGRKRACLGLAPPLPTPPTPTPPSPRPPIQPAHEPSPYPTHPGTPRHTTHLEDAEQALQERCLELLQLVGRLPGRRPRRRVRQQAGRG